MTDGDPTASIRPAQQPRTAAIAMAEEEEEAAILSLSSAMSAHAPLLAVKVIKGERAVILLRECFA